MKCDCELRNRQWNGYGKCLTCGGEYDHKYDGFPERPSEGMKPKCAECGHVKDAHTAGFGGCWNNSCDCKFYRPAEDTTVEDRDGCLHPLITPAEAFHQKYHRGSKFCVFDIRPTFEEMEAYAKQYAAKRLESERPNIIAEFVKDVEKDVNIDGLDRRADDAGRIWRSLREVQKRTKRTRKNQMNDKISRKYSDQEYEEFEYFQDDELITGHSQKIVKTRTPHQCITIYGSHLIPVGTRAICERAIDVDRGRVSNYVCLDCADKYLDEMNGDDE